MPMTQLVSCRVARGDRADDWSGGPRDHIHTSDASRTIGYLLPALTLSMTPAQAEVALVLERGRRSALALDLEVAFSFLTLLLVFAPHGDGGPAILYEVTWLVAPSALALALCAQAADVHGVGAIISATTPVPENVIPEWSVVRIFIRNFS